MASTYLDGSQGPITFDYALYLSNIRGEELTRLKAWQGTVEMSNFRDEAWTLDLTMPATDALNPISDWVLVVITASAGGTTESFPFGLYRFKVPNVDMLETRSTWNLTGYSGEMVPLGDAFPRRYNKPPGTGVLAASKAILQDLGFPNRMIDFPPLSQDQTLRNWMRLSPVQDASKMKKLRIINKLLGAGGFTALQARADGRLHTRDIEELDQRDPDFIYGPNGDQMVLPPIRHAWTDDRFANMVTVISGDTQDETPMFAVAKNLNPNSLGSIPVLGRTVAKEPIRVATTTSQERLDRRARGLLQQFSGFNRNVSLTIKPDPRRDILEVGRLAGFGRAEFWGLTLGDLNTNYRVNNFRWSLEPEATHPMEMELSKVDKV